MFVVFTPFTFFFFRLYLYFIFILFYISDFFLFWLIIECANIIFMGMAYRVISYGFSNLMVYFIIQAVSSVNILVFYSLSLEVFVLLFLFLKLAVFPFFLWYFVVMAKLNNFLFFVSSTFHKLPSFLIFIYFLGSYSFSFLFIGLVFTLFYSSVFIYNLYSFRRLLVFSSVGNNVWFILASFVSFSFFSLFFLVYAVNFFLSLYFFGGLFSSAKFFSFFSLVFFIGVVLSVAGFPPFPVFFFKLGIFYSLLFTGGVSFLYLLPLLVFAVFMMASYIRFLLSVVVNRFGLAVFSLFF